MLPTDGLGVKIAVVRSRDGVGVCLSTDLDTLVGEVDVFTKESALSNEGHKYRARKAARIAVDVATIVVVIAVVGAEKSGMSSC
jgi:hypothetical protein